MTTGSGVSFTFFKLNLTPQLRESAPAMASLEHGLFTSHPGLEVVVLLG